MKPPVFLSTAANGLYRLLSVGLLILALQPAASAAAIENYRYQVIKSYPHDKYLFTQGLQFHDGILYESAGQYGRSRLISRHLNRIKPINQRTLPRSIFAEGISLLNDKIYQLSWKAGRGFIYQREDFSKLGEFRYRGEGWGLCNNGKQLIFSNGSNRLQFMDPDSFEIVKTLAVTIEGRPLQRINELAWVNGQIYANIWRSNWIVIIDPDSGKVTGRADLSGLLPAKLQAEADVLNGIAYDEQGQRLLVTGKNWPKLYHIELLAIEPAAEAH